MRLASPLLALGCLLFALNANARFVVEQGGLKISFPPEAKAKYPGGFDMALANFGAPKYGGALMGQLIYIDKEFGQDYTCSPACKYACQDFSSATPRLDLRSDPKETYIMLVDRGPTEPGTEACKFAQKVYNAQQAGARGVVVVNYEDKLTTMEAPDEDDEVSYRYLQNISIPATFIAKSSGEALKSLMKNGGAASKVYASLDWTDALPKQKQVEWEFWTNSNDQCGPICDVQRDFIKAFVPIAKEFDGNGWTKFSPHYIVWTCPGSYKESEECRSQCIHHGRYCAPDPDGSIKEGYSGAEVVQENLRQLCLFKLANATGKPYLWWDYVTMFADKCTMDSKAYGQKCAEEVFTELNTKDPWGNIEDLHRCIGNIDDDTPHSIMEEQLTAQAGDGKEGEVFILPTLRINGAQYRGKLAVGEVLRALCAGFEEGNRPRACDRAFDDACMPGGKGYNECAANKDGKTQCVATFSGFSCTCGQGFISHKEDDGSEKCLDINECLSITQLDPKCTCERCGCKNTYGGYECVTDIPDECANNYGGCWHTTATVKGKQTTFSACHDNLSIYKDALAHGQPVDTIPLHNCTCPPCFSAVQKRGKITCQARCNLDYCDLDVGVCHAEPGAGSLTAGSIAAIVLGVVALVAGGGFVAYRLYMRGLMQAEVRAIMAQYMPLGDSDVGEGRGLMSMGNGNSSSGVGV